MPTPTETASLVPYLTKRIGFCPSPLPEGVTPTRPENTPRLLADASRSGRNLPYLVEVTIKGPVHPETGMIINYFDLDPLLEAEIQGALSEETPALTAQGTPSTMFPLENMVLFLWNNLAPRIATTGLTLHRLTLIAHPGLSVETEGPSPQMPLLTRRYTFSAAHKLWNPAFSDEENRGHFGACVNLHGHNYTLEVSITGQPHPETGLIMNLAELDAGVQARVLNAVDHRYLDEDVAFLKGKLSTVENVAQIIYEQLAPGIPAPATLARIRLYESDNNWTEVLAPEKESVYAPTPA